MVHTEQRLGVVIGLNAAFLNIITEWLSDMKLGYCSTAFYLNESFCCWGAENGRTGLHAVSEETDYAYQAAPNGIAGALSGL